MTNPVSSSYLSLPLIPLYRDFERFDIQKVYAYDEDEGDQEGAAAQEMESLSIEAQTKPS